MGAHSKILSLILVLAAISLALALRPSHAGNRPEHAADMRASLHVQRWIRTMQARGFRVQTIRHAARGVNHPAWTEYRVLPKSDGRCATSARVAVRNGLPVCPFGPPPVVKP